VAQTRKIANVSFMEIELHSIRKSLNKAFLRETISREDFDQSVLHLRKLVDKIDEAKAADETEEHHKFLLPDFFKGLGFDEHYINTDGRTDLAIHNGQKKSDTVGVMIETKRPGRSEMISRDNPNKKALHEAILYYLRERVEKGNSDDKHIIITDLEEWFIFDAQEFHRHFIDNGPLKEEFKKWNADQKSSSSTSFMYDLIADYLESYESPIEGTHFSFEDYRELIEKPDPTEEEERELIPLVKLLSPVHLLKETFANDSNSLDRQFYNELLYILGLEEQEGSSAKLIDRPAEEDRIPGTLIESTINTLRYEDRLRHVDEPKVTYGEDKEDQLFGVALELCILWINRILFLKLLEAQLYRYHREDEHFKFLNFDTVDEFDELNKLFFRVLAVKEDDRQPAEQQKYGHIPYLNSSLFDVSDLEDKTTRISGLDDKVTMPVYSKTVLKDEQGKSEKGKELNTLEYLFRFLEAYNFSAEGKEEIQEENKSLINASVLGLIFEKINGYKDGSFYTPGFITEYMCRETLRKAVVEKFREELGLPSPQTPLPPAGEGLVNDDGRGPYRTDWTLPDSLVETARHLRKNQTEAEDLLWELLRNKQLNGYKFRRQHPIKPGFVLDFYCVKEKLTIEIDGEYHNSEDQKYADEERTAILEDKGIDVIRFQNSEVLEQTEQVLQEIADTLDPPSPASGGRTEDGGNLTFPDLYNYIGPNRPISIKRANELVNSITVCDPAVGSGHFLVSALNELIAIKSDLDILCDEDYKVFRNTNVHVEHDELVVTHGDDELFEYNLKGTWTNGQIERSVNSEMQRLQKALFEEKRRFIEDSLFGVDINPNSVKICRLRLWIELLKHAYYTSDSDHQELEVLPNIDINIKQGNSLVSRFDLDVDLEQILDETDYTLDDYKQAVDDYKETRDQETKRELRSLIKEMKEAFTVGLEELHPEREKLKELKDKLYFAQNQRDFFGDSDKHSGSQELEVEELEEKVSQQQEVVDDLEAGTFYRQAFEWRFEFPEVLDADGHFTGFDVVIGNPPYIDIKSLEEGITDYLKENYDTVNNRINVFSAFLERVLDVVKRSGFKLSFILPTALATQKTYTDIRKLITDEFSILGFVRLPNEVFGDKAGDVKVDTGILILSEFKEQRKTEIIGYAGYERIDEIDPKTAFIHSFKSQNKWSDNDEYVWRISTTEKEDQILEKCEDDSVKLEEITKISLGLTPYDKYAGQTQEQIKNRVFHADHKKDETFKKLLAGSDVNRYSVTWNGEKWISYGDWLGAPREQEFFTDKRIIVKQIIDWSSKRIWATLTERELYNSQNAFNILKNSDYELEYILGVLNSKLMTFYHRKKFLDEFKMRFQKILIRDCRRFPIKRVNIDNARSLKKYDRVKWLVDKILTAKEDDPEADTSDLEAEIDQLVYELYGLTDEEIAIVEESVG